MAKDKGKKLFTHEVKLPTGDVSIDIRVNKHGWFSAEIGLDSISDTSIDNVRKWITDTVKRGKTLTFAPWIEIDSPEDRHRYGRHRDESASRDATLSINFKVLLLSTETFSDNKPRYGGRIDRFRISRACKVTKKLEVVADEGMDEHRRDSHWDVEDEDVVGKDREHKRNRLLPYTPQRYQALVAMIDNIEAARKRLDIMLVQSDDGARALDAAGGRLLLMAEPEKR